MNEDNDAIVYHGSKEEAKQTIFEFSKNLKPGDLILFDLGERNEKSLGGVNHVVMYAGIHNEKAMIVEEYYKGYDAYYRPIDELVFAKKAGQQGYRNMP